MVKVAGLIKAKKKKNDEFYTQYEDIQKEINAYLEYNPDIFRNKVVLLPCDDPEWSNFTKFFSQNFERLGIKKLISTSYANEKKDDILCNVSSFEINSPNYNEDLTNTHGKIFVLEKNGNASSKIDISDLQWNYLAGDGDFRSDEVKLLRDEADIIVTNPPFSLFREFVSWIMEANKQFLIIGNVNAINYKEFFPLLQNNKVWMGSTIHSGDREFMVPDSYFLNASGFRIDEQGRKYIRVKGVRWYTNLDHGRRHQPLQLMSMDDNIKYSKHNDIKGAGYKKYDDYDAIEVPYTDAIPLGYVGKMGVPITFLDKFNPTQFKIIGLDRYLVDNPKFGHRFTIDGKEIYARIVIEFTKEYLETIN